MLHRVSRVSLDPARGRLARTVRGRELQDVRKVNGVGAISQSVEKAECAIIGRFCAHTARF